MKTQLIGKSSFISTRLAYGCMRIAPWKQPNDLTAEDFAKAGVSVRTAFEAGYRLFDHADIYSFGSGEVAFGRVLRENPAMRDEIVLISKCGIRWAGDVSPDAPYRFDFSADYILRSCEGGLQRLNIETLDICLLHRPDFLMDPDEVAGAFDKLRRQGKVREFGVSNFSPSQLTMLQSRLPFPLIANQVEIHPGRIACLTDGTLDQCITQHITPLAWSPLDGGMFATGGTVPADLKNKALLDKVLDELDNQAAKYGVTRTAITLAWLLKHPSGIIPIVGSANPEHIRQAALADTVEMSREDWYRIMTAAWGERLP